VITNLLDADYAEMERDYHNQEFLFKHPLLYRVVDAYYTLKSRVLFYTVCKLKGHDLVDNGYATPDSGCIQMDCNRCGYSWPTHWLY